MNVSEIVNTVRNQLETTKLPLSGPDGMKTGFYGLFDNNGVMRGRPVTSSYKNHSVEQLIAATEAYLQAWDCEHSATVDCGWRGAGGIIVVSPGDDYRRSIAGTDKVYPRGVIRANLFKHLEFETGLYRELCSNLQMTRTAQNGMVRFSHTGNFDENVSMFVNDLAKHTGDFDSLVNMMEEYDNTQVNIRDLIDAVYPLDPETATDTLITRIENRRKRILEIYSREAKQMGRKVDGGKTTLWQAVNAVTTYLQHDGTRKGSPNKLDRMLAMTDDKEADRVWQIAEAMAA